MLLRTAALLLLALPAPQEPPFHLDLPAGYGPFQSEDGPAPGEVWVATDPALPARLRVEHYRVESLGARAELVARSRQQDFWPGFLRGARVGNSVIQPWSGAWAGQEEAAGTRVLYRQRERDWVILERIAVLGRHLVTVTWEGPEAEEGDGAALLGRFRIPEAWQAEPVPEEDRERGAGAAARRLPARGAWEILVDVSDFSFQEVRVEIRFAAFDPAEAQPGAALEWRLPPLAEVDLDWNTALREGRDPQARVALLQGDRCRVEADEEGLHRLRYRLPVQADAARARAYGIVPGPECLAFLDPLWLAVPLPRGKEETGWREPPPWRLEVRLPSHMAALSHASPESEVLEDEARVRRVGFPPLARGQAWPFVFVGRYREVRGLERRHWIRVAAKATQPREALREIERLDQALTGLWPGARRPWRVLTYPGVPDRSLPGVLLLDEEAGWLDRPLDSVVQGVTLRTGLARRLGAHAFSVRLRGVGSASPWLSLSLGEYAAARLLEAAGREAEAGALRTWWAEREAALGELPEPLSLLPWADLTGPRWLLCRGPRVWEALEREAGRETLDRVLDARLQGGGTWTTEDLRRDLEAATGRSLEAWFRAHVYGRIPPPQPEAAAGG